MLTRGKKIGGGIDWEFGVDMYTSLFKQITNKGLIYSTRSSAPYSVITYMRKNLKKVDIDIFITESLCYIPETNTVW